MPAMINIAMLQEIKMHRVDNFACGSVWVRNLMSDIKGGT
jgi:hypothetical protein